MMNLQLIENQPRWRVATVARFAKLMGVCIHVEGIPFGSNRSRLDSTDPILGGKEQPQAGQIGSPKTS